MRPLSIKSYDLMHRGMLALARAERNGIYVDVDYCTKMQNHLGRQIGRLHESLMDSEIAKQGRLLYGRNLNLDSDDQLSNILFNTMGLEATERTATGKASVSAGALEGLAVRVPEINDLVLKRKLTKAKDTYLANFLKEQVDGVIHTNFNLHLARSFRPSTDSPNLANVPVRDPVIKKIVRKAIKARPGHKLVCSDFKGIEVGIGACYHKDPTMIAYVSDKSKDMHRDMATECFILPIEWVTKAIRQATKGGFVFAQFYGDWYKSCAENLWAIVHTEKIATGVLLADHLASKGIHNIEDFENHLQKVEHAFWYDRFPIYTEWKKNWNKQYQKKGYFDTLTHFRCQGVMDRKQVCNYPIQGSAFHLMLQCIIWMDEDCTGFGWDSRICNQIYDDLMMDVHPDEEKMVIDRMKYYMTERLPEHWDWINVPVEAEAETTSVDGTWYEKREACPKCCKWIPKKDEVGQANFCSC